MIHYLIAIFSISLILASLIIFSFKSITDKEKTSPFESGFDPNSITRVPFCMKFYLIVVIFLVLDVEIALLLPMLFAGTNIFFFIVVVTLGTMYEWMYGGLNWMV